MKTAIELITEERQRQIAEEHFTPESDDNYKHQELLRAGICYAMTEVDDPGYANAAVDEWPFDLKWFKNAGGSVRNLVKAAALIAAEIDRELREEQRKVNQ